MAWLYYTCQWPGCNERLIRKGMCPKHKKRVRKEYDKTRDPAVRKMYGSERWKVNRKAFLKRNPVCVQCGRPATVVDHIQPHRGNPKLFWDYKNNWQALCKPCHDAKTSRYESWNK